MHIYTHIYTHVCTSTQAYIHTYPECASKNRPPATGKGQRKALAFVESDPLGNVGLSQEAKETRSELSAV
jgi:hypothetical protein